MVKENLLKFDGTPPFPERIAYTVGYDIESRVPGTGKLRFIEVKGRISTADTVTVTRQSGQRPDTFSR